MKQQVITTQNIDNIPLQIDPCFMVFIFFDFLFLVMKVWTGWVKRSHFLTNLPTFLKTFLIYEI